MAPSAGGAGTAVAVRGTARARGASCGGRPAETLFRNATLPERVAPADVGPGSVPLDLARDGAVVSAGPPLLFLYVDLAVRRIDPAFGDVTGGAHVAFDVAEESRGAASHRVAGGRRVPAEVRGAEPACVAPPVPRPGPVWE